MTPEQQLLRDFQIFLSGSSFSPGSVKNYLSDIVHFFNYLTSQNHYVSLLTLPFILSPQCLIGYKNSLVVSPLATANRRLSSLRKFCQFAIHSQLISSLDLSCLANFPLPPPDPSRQILHRYKNHLEQQDISKNTIKNYLSDVRTEMTPLSRSDTLAGSTLRRHQSSLHQFQLWQQRTVPSALPLPLPSASNSSGNRLLAFACLFALLCAVITFFLLRLTIPLHLPYI